MVLNNDNIFRSEDSTRESAVDRGQASLDHSFSPSDLQSWDDYPPVDPSLMPPQDYPTNGKDYAYSLSYDLENTPKAVLTSDWTFSPSIWPQSPYHESPLSSSSTSAGIYQDASWNPFEQSFTAAQNAVDNMSFIPGNNSFQQGTTNRIYPPGDPRGCNDYSCVSLSAIDETFQYDDGFEENDDTPPPGRYVLKEEVPQQQQKEEWQLAWGTPRRLRRGSTTSTKSTNSSTTIKDCRRRKTSDQGPKSPTSAEVPPNALKLRSTSTSTLKSTSRSIPPPTISSPKGGPRTNHNQVEKQYRNRLNGQFETLLQKLPRDEAGYTGGEKRISKAEVLVLAKKHITDLEREARELEDENTCLEGDVERLKRGWVDMCGIVLP